MANKHCNPQECKKRKLHYIKIHTNTHLLLDSIHIGVYYHLMNSKEIIKRLQKDGWVEVAHVGSHVQFKHPEKKGRVTVPHPKKDIPKGTLNSILKQAGWK